jgi:mRNA-degrading endonuclease toxin of MazEF toxin-antitoxin module
MHPIIKKFQQWFVVKEQIETLDVGRSFEEGQIWWCRLGENVGHEQCGKGDEFLRPIIVIKKFNRNLFYGIPTSSRYKNNKYYFDLKLKKNNTFALLSQMRAIDARRLKYKMARLPDADLIILKKAISKVILGKN